MSAITVDALIGTWRALKAQAEARAIEPVYCIALPYREWKMERRVWRMMMLRAPLRVRRHARR